MRAYTRARRSVQLSFALLFLALPFAASTRVSGSYVALKIGPVDLLEPATALSALLAALDARTARTLLVASLPLLALALLLGPVFCAWGCPFGLLSEVIDAARQRLRPTRWSERQATRARPARFLLLWALLLSSLPLAFPLAALLLPPRLLTVLPVEAHATRAVPVVSAVLLGALLLVELVGPRRITCRVLCPAGAAVALLRRRFTLAPRLDRARCRCAAAAPCLQECPWAVDPRTMTLLDGCTSCLACVERCPTDALAARFRDAASSAERVEEARPGLRRHAEEA